MSGFNRFLLKFLILSVMLLGLPLFGIFAAGYPIARYLEFPPQTRYVAHAPFSWLAFVVIALSVLAVGLPVAIQGFRSYKKISPQFSHPRFRPFPWWGWIGVLTGIIAWTLAWTRFAWFANYQPHTFSPLWFSYIAVVNALCYRRTGQCLLTDRTGFFLLLFPVSAVFWWFFEYLNRFVQNWFYVGTEFSPWAYFWFATLPFSTVLPAVMSTRQWLLSFKWVRQAYESFNSLRFSYHHQSALFVLALSAAGLAGVGVWSNYIFPLLWVSPLLIIICLQEMMKESSIFSQIAEGDWSGAVAAALAAMVCGGFWEMWNYFSLAKWQYSIPLVHRFQIFEMPLLGYAGYLSFGLECAVIGGMLEHLITNPKSS